MISVYHRTHSTQTPLPFSTANAWMRCLPPTAEGSDDLLRLDTKSKSASWMAVMESQSK